MSSEWFSNLTRWFLYLLIGSIAVGAALSIYAILAGSWGWVETRIILTAGTIAAASLCGMACGAAISRNRYAWLPGFGIALAIIGAAMLVAGLWMEAQSADYWKATASVCIMAIALGHVALLSIARVLPAHEWVQWLAGGLAVSFAAILVVIINATHVDDGTVRLLAVVGILDAAMTLVVPIVYFLDRRAFRAAQALAPATSPAPTAGSGPISPDLATLDAEIARLQARLDELEARRRAILAAAT